MPRYYVNMLARPNGDHEVHKTGCEHFPDMGDALALGDFSRIEYAVREARRTFPQSTACDHCEQASTVENPA